MLQKRILSTVITVVATAIVTVFGPAIALHPRWLRHHKIGLSISFAISQMVVALFAVVTGEYVVYQVNGLSFSKTSAPMTASRMTASRMTALLTIAVLPRQHMGLSYSFLPSPSLSSSLLSTTTGRRRTVFRQIEKRKQRLD